MSNTYDAMVVDYDLPEINGIEFLKIIRAKGDTTPLIIYTGVGREYAAIEALNYGADFFLKKGDDVQDAASRYGPYDPIRLLTGEIWEEDRALPRRSFQMHSTFFTSPHLSSIVKVM